MVIFHANFKEPTIVLQLENISLTFGEETLFDNISCIINPGERVGLVGPNGAGKSTLLKIIAGELEHDGGNITMSKTATVGYLPQDGVDPDPDCTLYEEMENAFGDLQDLETKVQQAREEVAQLEAGSSEYNQAMDQLGKLQDRLEPTNHLDIESLRWIEQFLSSYEGAVIIVSHDKAFLNKITKRTLALDNGDLLDYSGNYDYYEEKHAEYLEHRRKAYENQQKEIKEIQEFIDKFRYNASKAAQVQSRIKQLEKMDKI